MATQPGLTTQVIPRPTICVNLKQLSPPVAPRASHYQVIGLLFTDSIMDTDKRWQIGVFCSSYFVIIFQMSSAGPSPSPVVLTRKPSLKEQPSYLKEVSVALSRSSWSWGREYLLLSWSWMLILILFDILLYELNWYIMWYDFNGFDDSLVFTWLHPLGCINLVALTWLHSLDCIHLVAVDK
jgi:hypothetical protein